VIGRLALKTAQATSCTDQIFRTTTFNIF